MQRDLDALMDWGSTWGMKFNAKKCNIMRVSRSRKPLQHFYSLGSEILQEVSDAKYLGIQIDNKLDWTKHISTVADRGQSKLAFLNRNLKGCPKKLRDTAYISLIRPALEYRLYSCSVWHPLDWRQYGNSLALCYFAVVMELPDSLWMHCKSEFGVIFLRCSQR